MQADSTLTAETIMKRIEAGTFQVVDLRRNSEFLGAVHDSLQAPVLDSEGDLSEMLRAALEFQSRQPVPDRKGNQPLSPVEEAIIVGRLIMIGQGGYPNKEQRIQAAIAGFPGVHTSRVMTNRALFWSSFVTSFAAYLTSTAPASPALTPQSAPVPAQPLMPRSGPDGESKIRWDVPQQLPGQRRAFVNRTAELDVLERSRDAATRDGRAAVAVIRGGQGMGKSALGERWAHTHRNQFTDGQLYVNFAEIREAETVSMSDTLSAVLRGFGVAEHAMPHAYFEKVQKYRTITARRRVLVVLDDVEHAAQVLPMIPDSVHSAVIVTTRMSLDELTLHGATRIALEPLPPDKSTHLLEELLGTDRCAAEPDAVRQLAGFCGGLPIALTICAAILNSEPGRPILSLVDELGREDTRLTAMSLTDAVSVQRIFDAAADGLPTTAERLYVALGLSPAPSFSVHSAAAAAELTVAECERLLDVLDEAQLLDRIFVDGERRYRFHDLIRIHARQRRLRRNGPAVTADVVAVRVAQYYSALAQSVDRAITAQRLRYAPPDATLAELPVIDGMASALQVFERERAGFVAAQIAAEMTGAWSEVWVIAEALWPAYHERRYPQEARDVFRRGANAAEQLGLQAAQARLLSLKARTELDLNLIEAARASVEQARAVCARLNDVGLRASVEEVAAILATHVHDYALAEQLLVRSRELFKQIGERRGAAIQEYLLGKALHDAGDDAGAAVSFAIAWAEIEALADEPLLCRIGLRWSHSLSLAGDHGMGRVVAERVAQIAHRCGAELQEAAAFQQLALFSDEAGDAAAALQLLERALALYVHVRSAVADPLAVEVARRRA